MNSIIYSLIMIDYIFFLFKMSKLKAWDFRRTQQLMIKEDKQKILTFE